MLAQIGLAKTHFSPLLLNWVNCSWCQLQSVLLGQRQRSSAVSEWKLFNIAVKAQHEKDSGRLNGTERLHAGFALSCQC